MDGNIETSVRNVVVFECVEAAPTNSGPSTAAILGQAARAIRVPCSGKLQPEHLLKAFERGADLVVVLTCRNGDCRYLEGRRRIERRLGYVRGLLDEIGLGGDRLLLLDQRRDSDAESLPKALISAQANITASPLGRIGGTGG